MKLVRTATHEDVMDAFQHDSLVVSALASKLWPHTFPEKAAVLRKAGRPVDKILALPGVFTS